jgi:hypothetical protein
MQIRLLKQPVQSLGFVSTDIQLCPEGEEENEEEGRGGI